MQHTSHVSLGRKARNISMITVRSVSIRIKTGERRQREPVVSADNSARQQLALLISKTVPLLELSLGNPQGISDIKAANMLSRKAGKS